MNLGPLSSGLSEPEDESKTYSQHLDDCEAMADRMLAQEHKSASGAERSRQDRAKAIADCFKPAKVAELGEVQK